MGQKRTKPPIHKPGRIPPDDLAAWMRVNGISINQLAVALAVQYPTVNGWLRGYQPVPAWLEQRINFVAMGDKPKLPLYGKRWEVEQTTVGDNIAPLLDTAPPPLSAPVAACKQCGGPLDAVGDRCLWEFCPTNDGNPDD